MAPANRRRALLVALLLLALLLGVAVDRLLFAERPPAAVTDMEASGGPRRALPQDDATEVGPSGGPRRISPEDDTAGGPIVDPPKKTEPVNAPDDAGATKPVPPPPSHPFPSEAKPGRFSFWIVDADSGKPVAGARVLLGITLPDGSDGGWHGDRTGPDGAVRYDVLETMSRDAGRKVEESEIRDWKFDLRVRAAGFESARIRSPEPSRQVRLVRDPTPPVPGTVRGVVTKADGTAFHGRLKVESMENEWGWYACPYAWTDERGNYTLEGIPAGFWKMRVSADGDFQTVVVPEGGEAWLVLKVPGSGVDEGSDALPAENREVVVSGFVADALHKYWMRAETRPGHFFRVAVTAGKARFPALPVRHYRFVLERPGLEEIAVEADVAAGEGAQGVDFPRD